jgi:hypothetical protein
MKITRRTKIVISAAGLLAVAGSGAAVAAAQESTRSSESKAVIDDAAKELGISSSKLSDALKKALGDRVDAAVAAGRITKAEGDAVKQRITSDDFPLLGGLHHGLGRHGIVGRLDAAAGYIGITEAQLRAELEGGKSIAQVAKDHNKPVDGLVDALYADAKQKLDDAVSTGRLTKTQETEMLSVLKARITDMINKTGVDEPHFSRPGFGFRHSNGPTT